jgi:uncharacterized protein (UPF0261 family)
MALNTHLSLASWGVGLDAALNVLNGGYLEFYTGAQPATPDVAVTSQTLLATLDLSATAFSATSAGTKTANAITSGTAVATGTATWARAYKSDGTTAVIDGSCGTSGTDFILATTSIVASAVVSCSGWSVSCPVGQ